MANPIISRTELLAGDAPMTVNGVVKKTALLLGISATTGFGLFFFTLMSGISSGVLVGLFIVAMLATMGIGLTTAFKPHLAKTLSVPYAALEGVVIGVASAFAFYKAPSVPLLALSATFVSAAVMLTLYSTGIIKVTEKFRSLVVSASIAIMIVYAIQWVMSLVFGSSIPHLFNGGMIAIGFSVFTTLIASFFLLLDFKNIEDGVMYGVNEEFEWVYGISVLATLVWMYIEFLRLIGYLQE